MNWRRSAATEDVYCYEIQGLEKKSNLSQVEPLMNSTGRNQGLRDLLVKGLLKYHPPAETIIKPGIHLERPFLPVKEMETYLPWSILRNIAVIRCVYAVKEFTVSCGSGTYSLSVSFISDCAFFYHLYVLPSLINYKPKAWIWSNNNYRGRSQQKNGDNPL